MTRKQFWPGMLAMALIFAMMIAGCDNGTSSGGDTNSGKAGIHLGIIGFNYRLTEKKISLLEDDTKNEFQSFVNNMGMEDGTGLYYAVDNGINRLLQAVNLPDNVINVSIVTFTDGLDNVSISLANNQYDSRDAYRDAVQNRISTVKIKNLPINAYSIGMRGPDVVDVDAFTTGIKALASSPDNFYELNNMNQLNETFAEIARSLSNVTKSQSITLKIPGGIEDGTKIRFTFDNNITDASISNYYIEGNYKRGGSLENIVYQGLNTDSGTTVKGKVEGAFVSFTFVNVSASSGGSVSTSTAKQWEYRPSNSIWQINSEFEKDGYTDTWEVKKSSLIMLVLDCTNSLGSSNFYNMKNVVNRFIDVLLSSD